MLALGPLSFLSPLALLGLALLPALWWMMRATPPSPRRMTFPPIRLLFELTTHDQHAVRTPIWLMLLRLILAATIILAAAHPIFDARSPLPGSGPVVLLIDDGWAAAADWPARQAAMTALIDAADRTDRPVVMISTAAQPAAAKAQDAPLAMPARRARELIAPWRPKPWETNRAHALAQLEAAKAASGWTDAAVVWLNDGLEEQSPAMPAARLLDRLRAQGEVSVFGPRPAESAMLLRADQGGRGELAVSALRAGTEGAITLAVRLAADDGVPLTRQDLMFAAGSHRAEAVVPLPAEWLERLTRIEIEGSETAGAVVLIDERWRRHPVGIVGEAAAAVGQPLLGNTYYLERALEPFAEVRHGTVSDLLRRDLSVLVMPDVGSLDDETATTIARWVHGGGVLVRFAGPRLAAAAGAQDPLLPVPLRPGDRTLGGALSWGAAGRLAPFEATGPLHDLQGGAEIAIERQVLAEPSLDVGPRTWARLQDGTPLITGARRGEGWLVLVHTTANTEWSNLPLSGLFVDILKRIVGLSAGTNGRIEGPPLAPIETLDGFGRLGPPPPQARAIAAERFADQAIGPESPPGFYGSQDLRLALNLSASVSQLRALPVMPPGIAASAYNAHGETDLRAFLLALAVALLLADLAISLALRGLLVLPPGRRGGGRQPAAVAAVLLSLAPGLLHAQAVVADGSAPAPALSPRLAYILTGSSEVDRTSEAGLTGLTTVINRRTAAELGPPAGVRPESDDLAFYPLLYWPLTDDLRLPSPAESRRLRTYLRNGGTIVFDSRGNRGLAEIEAARGLARALDLPPLMPLPDDHVLRRSYYLLNDMPGRTAGGAIWIEAGGEHVNDGVSGIIAASNDWAGAWAVDEALRPLNAVVPGGEKQRELAFRAGINLVMYVLTGNYKADQVHLPAILDRLRR